MHERGLTLRIGILIERKCVEMFVEKSELGHQFLCNRCSTWIIAGDLQSCCFSCEYLQKTSNWQISSRVYILDLGPNFRFLGDFEPSLDRM